MDNVKNKQNETLTHTMHFSEALSNIGSIFMQVSMSINAIKNLGNIWSNEDLSTGEKMLQTMTALGTLIPTLTSLTKMLNAEKLKATGLSILEATAQAGANVAKALGIHIDYAKGASGWAALGPALLFVAIAATVVAALYGIYKGIEFLINAETKEEKAARQANKALEESKNAANEAKQAYEDLKNKVSDYDSAVKALEECTKGTQEWRDAFQEVLNKANELIEAYPQLLTYSGLFKEDGTLDTNILNQAVNDYQQRAMASSINVIKNQANVDKTKLDVQKQKFNNTVSKQLSEVDVYNVRKKDPSESYDYTYTTSAKNYTDQIVNSLLSNPNVNYNNQEELSKIIKESLLKNNEFANEEELDFAVENISNKILDMSEDFQELSNETQKTATAMQNAKKLIAQEFFGEELDTSDVGKNIGYTSAYNEAVKKQQDQLNNYIYAQTNKDTVMAAGMGNGIAAIKALGIDAKKYNEGIKIQSKDLAEEYLKFDSKAQQDKWKFDSTKIENGELIFQFKDLNNEIQELRADVLTSTLAEQRVYNDREAIIKAGEARAKELKSQYGEATLGFLNDSNFNNVTFKDLAKLKAENKNIYEALNVASNDDKALKEKIADILQIPIEDVNLDTIKNSWEQLDTVLSAQDNLPEYISKYLSNTLKEGLTSNNLESVKKMYTQALASMGEDGVNILNSIAEQAGDEAGAVMGVLSSLDLTAMDAQGVNKALSDLGINFKLTEGQIYSLKNILKDISTVTVESAQETYKEISSILSKLKEVGDTIEEEDYQKLLSLNPAIESFFTTLADGTHMLTGEVQDFKKAMQTATMGQLYQAQENAATTAKAYNTMRESSGASSNISSYIANQRHFNASGSNLYDQYKDEADAMLQILSYNGESIDKINSWKAQIKDGENLNGVLREINQSYRELITSEEDFAEKSQQASKDVIEAAEAIKETQYQFEISNAGLDYETTENYANILMEVHEAEGLSKDAARELAIANQRLDRGLTSLNDNFEQWSSNLKNNSRETAEYAQTISDLRKSFADLLNIADGNELSLKWIEKWANDANEMAKILDGDTEAIQRFRESAFMEITTNVFDEVKESVQELFDSLEKADNSEIYDSLQLLINQLNNSTISAEGLKNAIDDIGNAEIGSGAVLSQEYVDALNTMLAQGLLTEQQLNDIFASIGYKPKVTTETVAQSVFVPEYTTKEEVTDIQYKEVGHGHNKEHVPITTKKSMTWQTGGKYMEQQIPVVQIESADKAGGNIEIVNAGTQHINPSYGSTTSRKNNNSGSSGSSPTTKAASHNHEVNRYSNEENALKGLSEQYDRLNKAKDKAFGAGRIQAIDNEIKHLQQLKKAQGDYVEAVVGAGNAAEVAKAIYEGKNIGSMIANGQLGGTIAQDYNALYSGYDASGKGIEYTAKDDAGNEWLVSSGYSLGEFNSLFGTNLSFDLDSYGNLQNKDYLLNFIQNLTNAENDSYSSVANPDAWSTTEYNKRMAYLEAIKERVEQYGETAELLTDKADEELYCESYTQPYL